MNVQLPEDLDRFVHSEVESGHFPSEGDVVAEALRLLRDRPNASAPATIAPGESASSDSQEPIWKKFQEITASIPAEEWVELPVDGAEQHDHYI